MIDFTNLIKQREELSVAINSNNIDLLHSVINRSNKDGPASMNLNYLDKDGQTPLHLACIKGNVYICKALMEAGASQSIKNRDGWFPIHLASYLGHLDIVFYLLDDGKKGTDIDVYDNNEPSYIKSHDFRLSFAESKHYRTSDDNEEDEDDEDDDDDYSGDSSSSSSSTSSSDDEDNNENDTSKKQNSFSVNFSSSSQLSQFTDFPLLFDEIFDLKNLDISAKDFLF